jgi:hypothetical protein
MAKQIGEIKIVGTFADITFYKMDGQYYVRMKSSLTGKRVKRDPKFARTMQSARRLGRGSQLASKVYRSLPKAEQVYALFKELKSIAVLALRNGKGEDEVMTLLEQRVSKENGPVPSFGVIKKKTSRKRPTPFFSKSLFRVRGGRKEKVRGRKRRSSRLADVLRE